MAFVQLLWLIRVRRQSLLLLLLSRLGFGAVFVRIILVYGPQEKDNINTISNFYENITVQTERAVLTGDSAFLVRDFNAKLGRSVIPKESYDMSCNGQSLYKMITCIK